MATALPRKAMGLGAGIIQTSGYIAGAISPILIGYLVQITGGSYKTAFISMCILLVLAGGLALIIRKSSFEEEHVAEPAIEKGQSNQ
jgi:cyanate permease